MKKTLLTLSLLVLATSAWADHIIDHDPARICIYNNTNNLGPNPGKTTYVQAQISVPGYPTYANHWGNKAQYNNLSCVSTAGVTANQIVHVFSVGATWYGNYFTDCNYNVIHVLSKESKLTGYYKSYQSDNGHTICKFLYFANKWHGG